MKEQRGGGWLLEFYASPLLGPLEFYVRPIEAPRVPQKTTIEVTASTNSCLVWVRVCCGLPALFFVRLCFALQICP